MGETEKQLVHRYGGVTSRMPASQSAQGRTYRYGEYLYFRSEDWAMIALVIQGQCEEITYTKKGGWTEEQFKHLLEINGGRSQWEEQKSTNPASRREWKRRDKTMAKWTHGAGLEIQTPKVKQVRAAVDKAANEEAAKLPKF